jgi:diguanylate cyclase (GGDEF)-like protein
MSAPASGLTLLGAHSATAPVLTMLEGAETSRVWRIGERAVIIGRDLDNAIPVGDAKASRQHARLTWTNPNVGNARPMVLVEDLGSTNGTILNGQRLSRPTLMGHGDKLLVGDCLFAFSLGVEEDIEAQRRLVQHATTDALTSLANREMFERTLRREFERARRYGRPLSMLLFSLDGLRELRGNYGCSVAELVLRQVGRIVRDNLRLPDLGARIGDAQFGILLPETPGEGATIAAERLRAAMERFPMLVGEQDLHATITVAVSPLDGSFATCDAWLAASQATFVDDTVRNVVLHRG